MVLNCLPQKSTCFIGRNRELAEIGERLIRSRLVTITGVGGSEKSRLALETGIQHIREYPDGVWWVDLEDITDAAIVVQEIAASIDVKETPNRPIFDSLVSHLESCQALIILDSCEKFFPECTHFVETLLRYCPNMQVLVTSRQPLHVKGEYVYQISGLSLPLKFLEQDPNRLADPSDAMQLFEDRGRLVQPSFAITPQNYSLVAQVCARLSGLPLAIELVAARLQSFSLSGIAVRLDDCFMPISNKVDRVQQAFRSASDWSYKLLSAQHQTLLNQLSIFRRGWTIEAAEAAVSIPGTITKNLQKLQRDLIDLAMVVAEPGSEDRVRFSMPDAIRQPCYEKLGKHEELGKVADRLVRYYVRLIDDTEQKLHEPGFIPKSDMLYAERDNLRQCLEWTLGRPEGNVELGVHLANSLTWFWLRSASKSEGLKWLVLAGDRLAAAKKGHETHMSLSEIQTAFFTGILAMFSNHRSLSAELIERVRVDSRFSHERQGEAVALLLLGIETGFWQADERLGIQNILNSEEIFRELSEFRSQVAAMTCAAYILGRADPTKAQGVYAKAIALARKVGFQEETVGILAKENLDFIQVKT